MWGEGLGEGRRDNFFGQMFIIIPKPECFFSGDFGGDSLTITTIWGDLG